MPIPEWKCERIAKDFVVGLPKTLRKFDSIWVIIDRLTKSAYFIPVQITYIAQKLAQIYICEIIHLHWVRPWVTELLRESLDKVKVIQAKLLPAQSRHKEYVDRKVRDLEFMVGEQVLLKVSPMKAVMRLRKKVKLSPRFISPFEILSRVGKVSNELALHTGLLGFHPVFYVSMLNRYHGDGSYIIRWDSVLLDENLSYEKEPIAILDREVRKLRSKEIVSVKVQWMNRPVEEATRETSLIYEIIIPRIMGISRSIAQSRITKSAGKKKSPTGTKTSSTTPTGFLKDLSAICNRIVVGLGIPNPNSL
ncbi:uncharacterized protein LOC132066473 [Lycium ferocissimum]|uniref:uncharacterized protein LOC132066473 n=1 Tax=Lycium ferocissimum TaxID=112874 RepID=UPI00281517CE|nr:uncharacterized protein LOC132066473 [Lycium ferocissimum]